MGLSGPSISHWLNPSGACDEDESVGIRIVQRAGCKPALKHMMCPAMFRMAPRAKSEYCKDWRFHPILAAIAIAIAIGRHFLLFVLRDLLGLEDVLECVTLSEIAP